MNKGGGVKAPGRIRCVMLSVVILHERREPALALTLARLVEGALDGLVGDVALVDAVGDPLAAALAEEGGCALLSAAGEAPAGVWRRGVEATRGAFILALPSGLAPRPGWAGAARETLALAAAGGGSARAVFPGAAPAGAGLLARLRRRPAMLLAARGEALASAGPRALEAALRRAGARRVPGFAVDERTAGAL